jgi:hypothetical protein
MVKLHSGVLSTWGVLKDISVNGLLVKSNHKFNPDVPIDIEVIMPDGETATIKGVVRRIIITSDANMKFGVGVEVIEKDLKYRSLVRYASKKNEHAERILAQQ